MTPDGERADRDAAVRGAAADWQRAGVIDEATRQAIAATVPDDRVRVGPVFRVLLFLFTLVAVGAGFAFVAMLLDVIGLHFDSLFAGFALVTGIVLALATDFQIVRGRRVEGGTEAATSLLAIGYLMAAAAWLAFETMNLDFRDGLPALCLTAAVLAAAAAWRWGYPLYAGTAAAALLIALARLPFGRLLWIALALAAAPLLLRLGGSPRLPPSHRASWTLVLSVALAGLYAAVHLGSWEAQLVERLGRDVATPPGSDLLGGCRRRRRR